MSSPGQSQSAGPFRLARLDFSMRKVACTCSPFQALWLGLISRLRQHLLGTELIAIYCTPFFCFRGPSSSFPNLDPKGSVFYAKSGVVRNLHQICIWTRKVCDKYKKACCPQVLPNTADDGLDITFVNTQDSTEYTYVTVNIATGCF